ncbi:MAG TPA: hypothetical protein VL362_00910 [Patescibacteria group bacterium]|jgi:hypothetical protein|nr:hypothetical protein [Patescibacteria group bacterium]
MSTTTLEHSLDHPVRGWVETMTPAEAETATGELVRNEFEKLWNIYTGRRAGLSFAIGNRRIDDEVIATRYFHERDIEEVYWRTRIYGVAGEQKTAYDEAIFIHILSETQEQEIHVDADGMLTVKHRPDASSPWQDADEATTEAVSFEFFNRTMVAAQRHSERSPGDQLKADAQALAMLYARYPMLQTPTTGWD